MSLSHDCPLKSPSNHSFVQTGIHHVSVLIHRKNEMEFEIFTPVTWARSVWELICLNAAPFGYIVESEA